MREFVRGHELIYYGGDVDRLRACTSQVHGHLHLAEATRRLGPPMVYAEYPMERVCGQVKPHVHSRNKEQININLANNYVEIERFKCLEFTADLEPDFPVDFGKHAEGQNTGNAERLFELADRHRYVSHEYDHTRYLLLGPVLKRTLSYEEKGHLADFNTAVGGAQTRDELIESASDGTWKLWGRALCGEKPNADAYTEQVGSEQSVAVVRASERRDDSWVWFTMENEDRLHVGYFGRVLYYLVFRPAVQEDDSDDVASDQSRTGSEYLLAYVQTYRIIYLHDVQLVVKGQPWTREFIDIGCVQELVGRVKTRGCEFFIRSTTCFWSRTRLAIWKHESNDEWLQRVGILQANVEAAERGDPSYGRRGRGGRGGRGARGARARGNRGGSVASTARAGASQVGERGTLPALGRSRAGRGRGRGGGRGRGRGRLSSSAVVEVPRTAETIAGSATGTARGRASGRGGRGRARGGRARGASDRAPSSSRGGRGK